MQLKTLPLLLLAATSMAAPEAAPADSDSYQSYLDQLDSIATKTDYAQIASELPTDFSIPTNIPTGAFQVPPSSIMSVIMTAVPASYLQNFGNPTSRSSIISEISAGHYPDWYKSLPADVKTYFATAYGAEATATGAQKTGDSTATSGPKATATGGSGSSSPSTSTSEGAAAPTGAFAVGLAGAAGVLGLAIAL
ncbi:hypothetical protein BBP40_006853 [Aspergillus hancockii]|nr:hypothetical protein BBP40_006853 [Aspergillus hancockii]